MAARRVAPRLDREKLARNIALKREKLGLSQRKLSAMLGLPPMTMHLIESDQRGIDIVEFVELSRALSEDPVDFLRQALADSIETKVRKTKRGSNT